MTDFYLYPTGDSAMGDWSGSFADVDDITGAGSTADDGTTEIEEGDAGATQAVFNCVDHTTEAGTISNIRFNIRGSRSGGAGGVYYAMVVKIGGTTDVGPQHTAGWATHFEDFAQNPDTSAAWTWTNVDDLIIGCEGAGGSGSNAAQVTALWAVVTYGAAAGTYEKEGSVIMHLQRLMEEGQ